MPDNGETEDWNKNVDIYSLTSFSNSKWLACLLYSTGKAPQAIYTSDGKCVFPND